MSDQSAVSKAVPAWLVKPAKAGAETATNTFLALNETSKLGLTCIIKVRALVPINKGDITVIKAQDELLAAIAI